MPEGVGRIVKRYRKETLPFPVGEMPEGSCSVYGEIAQECGIFTGEFL